MEICPSTADRDEAMGWSTDCVAGKITNDRTVVARCVD